MELNNEILETIQCLNKTFSTTNNNERRKAESHLQSLCNISTKLNNYYNLF